MGFDRTLCCPDSHQALTGEYVEIISRLPNLLQVRSPTNHPVNKENDLWRRRNHEKSDIRHQKLGLCQTVLAKNLQVKNTQTLNLVN